MNDLSEKRIKKFQHRLLMLINAEMLANDRLTVEEIAYAAFDELVKRDESVHWGSFLEEALMEVLANQDEDIHGRVRGATNA